MGFSLTYRIAIFYTDKLIFNSCEVFSRVNRDKKDATRKMTLKSPNSSGIFYINLQRVRKKNSRKIIPFFIKKILNKSVFNIS